MNLFYPDRVERYVSKQETEVIVSDASGYVLRVAPEQFDLRRFERLSEEADRV